MAVTEARRQTQDLILTCAEPTNRSSQEHSVRASRPSAVTTTTFTDAALTTTCVGAYVIPENGSPFGQVRQIKSFTGTTATIDAAWGALESESPTSLRIWMNGDVIVRVTTADAVAPYDVIASAHASLSSEPDDFWANKGYVLIGISGTNAGSAKAVSTFTSSTGTFAAGAQAATAVGDLFVLRKMLRPAADVEATVTPKKIERRLVGLGAYDADMPIPITSDGNVKLDIEQRPITTPGASGVQVTAPVEVGDMLQDFMTLRRDTGGTVSGITSTTCTAGAAVWSVGGFALMNTGEATQIYAVSSTTLTHSTQSGVTSLTTGSVQTNSIAYASASYVRKATDFYTRCFDLYRGGKLRQVFHGCMPKLTINVTRDQTVKFSFDYMTSEALEYNVDRPVAVSASFPIPIADFGVPVDGKGARCLFDGVKVLISNLTIDMGLEPVMRPSLSGLNQYDGCFLNLIPASGRFSILADQDDVSGFRGLADRFRRNRPIQFLYQKGTAPGSTFCIGIPALIATGTTFNFQEGQGYYDVPFTCLYPETAVSNGTQLYPVATYPSLPAISIGWL